MVRRGRGLDIAERIERPGAPDDDVDPTGVPAGLDEVLAARLAERFVALYGQVHPDAA